MSRSAAREQLRSFINRIERLVEERKTLVADITEVYSEAGGSGFNTKIMRKLIARRAMDKAELQEEDALLENYESAMRDDDEDEEPDPLA